MSEDIKCDSCEKESSFELIEVKMKVGYIKLCPACYRSHNKALKEEGNWKKTLYASDFPSRGRK